MFISNGCLITELKDLIKTGQNHQRKNHRIAKAYTTISNWVFDNMQKAASTSSNENKNNSKWQILKLYIDFFVSDAAVVSYTLVEEGNSFEIFEKLNDRGEPLSKYTLTRNMIYNMSDRLYFKNHTDWSSKDVIKAFDESIDPNCKENITSGVSSDKNRDALVLNNWNMQNPGKISANKYMNVFYENFENLTKF